MYRLVMNGEHSISQLPSLGAMDPHDFAVKDVKEMGVDAKLFCLNFAPFILRISVSIINLDEDSIQPYEAVYVDPTDENEEITKYTRKDRLNLHDKKIYVLLHKGHYNYITKCEENLDLAPCAKY